MNKNRSLGLAVIIMVIFLFSVSEIFKGGVKGKTLDKADSQREVLVIYSSENNQFNPELRLLDMSIGHFTENITFKSAAAVSMDDTKDKSHIFYYGQKEEDIPPAAVEIISSFEGPTVAVGYNPEKLGKKFTFVQISGDQEITKLEMPDEEGKARNIGPNIIFKTEIKAEAEILVEGKGITGIHPFIVKKEDNYYVATTHLAPPYSVFFSQVLNTVFGEETSKATPAYLRLEDVHPLADAEGLMEIAKYLKKESVPYMIAVIPVYTDPETKKEYHFNDSPKVLDALRYMQDNGGSIVLHGYTHQFRNSETGEGFEFWDVEYDMPIYREVDGKPENKKQNDFSSKEEYQAYMDENKAYEAAYVKERLTKGVQELTNFGLYPLAFEAPHYTMSQNGYRVVSEHFSTYVGQVQLSDEDWKTMETTPYVSKPAFLHGMTLLPETIGYVKPDDQQALEKMMKKAEEYQISEGGMIGGFYHPYLGIEGLKEVIKEMKSIPDLNWIDLKKMENTVEVENVSIKSSDGTIETEVDSIKLMSTSADFYVYHVKRFVETVTWGIAGIGVAAVVTFTGYTLSPRTRKKTANGRKK